MSSSRRSGRLTSIAMSVWVVLALAACTASPDAASAPGGAPNAAGPGGIGLHNVSPGTGPLKGGDDPDGDGDGDQDEHVIPPAAAVVVQIRTVAGAQVLTDAAGFTLYTFSADAAMTSNCTAACSLRWRPAFSSGGKPQAGPGASLADIGSIRRSDGRFQVTYRGAPLYLFAGDTRAGQRNGANRSEFGGRFSCLPPSGKPTSATH